MSKFFNYLSVALLGASVVVGFTACQDEDFDVSEATLKQKAYDNAFINQFGKPDPNQSWDFYAQAIDGLKNNAGTRASGNGWSVNPRDEQPAYITGDVVARYNTLLPEGQNNYTRGQSEYDLYSTGKFTISAIWYGGQYEINGGFETHLYICFYDNDNVYHEEKLFDSVSGGNYRNPGLSCDVELPVGRKFWFKMTTIRKSGWAGDVLDSEEHDYITVDSHIKNYDYSIFPEGDYPNGWVNPDPNGVGMPYGYHNYANKAKDYYHKYNGPSMLMYDEVATTYGDDKIERYMVIGFEDCWENLHWLDFDYNDLVLYIDGELPVPVAKRFMMEDLTTYDFDFNDVVVDLEYKRAVLRAVGGIQPVFIALNDPHGGESPMILSEELHEWMWKNQPNNPDHTETDEWWYVDAAHPKGQYYKPINVDAENGVTLVPVLLNQWAIPLTDTQLSNFPENPEDMQLRVLNNATWLPYVDVFNGGVTPKAGEAGPMIVYPVGAGNCPSIMATTVETRWMKEFQTITKSYPTFWKGNNPSSDQDYNNLWYNYNVNNAYVYNP